MLYALPSALGPLPSALCPRPSALCPIPKPYFRGPCPCPVPRPLPLPLPYPQALFPKPFPGPIPRPPALCPIAKPRRGRPAAAPVVSEIALPVHAQHELDRAPRVGAAETRQLVAGNRAAADAVDRGEVRVVERVEELRRELDVRATDEIRPLRDADVVRRERRAGHDQRTRAAAPFTRRDLDAVRAVGGCEVAAGRGRTGVAARRRRADRERQDRVLDAVVRPHVDLLAGVVEAQLEHLLHVVTRHPDEADVADVDETAALDLRRDAELPAADHAIERAVDVAAPVAAAAERQVVDDVRLELVRDVARVAGVAPHHVAGAEAEERQIGR